MDPFNYTSLLAIKTVRTSDYWLIIGREEFDLLSFLRLFVHRKLRNLPTLSTINLCFIGLKRLLTYNFIAIYNFNGMLLFVL